MDDLLPRFEGKTLKQQDPFSRDNLAVGDWKSYSSQRPSGVILLRDGWVKFH